MTPRDARRTGDSPVAGDMVGENATDFRAKVGSRSDVRALHATDNAHPLWLDLITGMEDVVGAEMRRGP